MEEKEVHSDEKVDLKKSAEVISKALDELPELYQATVFAFYYDQLSVEEIAVIMGCSSGVIRNRLNYARKYMIKILQDYQEAEEQKAKGIVPVQEENLPKEEVTKEEAQTEEVRTEETPEIQEEVEKEPEAETSAKENEEEAEKVETAEESIEESAEQEVSEEPKESEEESEKAEAAEEPVEEPEEESAEQEVSEESEKAEEPEEPVEESGEESAEQEVSEESKESEEESEKAEAVDEPEKESEKAEEPKESKEEQPEEERPEPRRRFVKVKEPKPGKVEFTVEALCMAVGKWADENCLGLTIAQKVCRNICKSENLKSGSFYLDGKEFAGAKKTVVPYGRGERKRIEEELQYNRKEKRARFNGISLDGLHTRKSAFHTEKIDKRIVIGIAAGILVIAGIAVGAALWPEKEKPPKNITIEEPKDKDKDKDKDKNNEQDKPQKGDEKDNTNPESQDNKPDTKPDQKPSDKEDANTGKADGNQSSGQNSNAQSNNSSENNSSSSSGNSSSSSSSSNSSSGSSSTGSSVNKKPGSSASSGSSTGSSSTNKKPGSKPANKPVNKPATKPSVKPGNGASASDKENEKYFIFPKSNKERLTESEVRKLTKEQLRIARNEIYARYGMKFYSKDLKEYFAKMPWYKPLYWEKEFDEKIELSMIEEQNVNLIRRIEAELE